LLRLNIATTFVSIVLLYFRYRMFLNWAISKGFYTRIDTLLTTGKLKWFLFECFLIVLNPYEFFQMVNFREYSPMVDKSFYINLNEVMTVLSMIKLFFFLRTFVYFTRFNDPRA